MWRALLSFLSSFLLAYRLRIERSRREEAERIAEYAQRSYDQRVVSHEIDLGLYRDGLTAEQLERMRKYERREREDHGA